MYTLSYITDCLSNTYLLGFNCERKTINRVVISVARGFVGLPKSRFQLTRDNRNSAPIAVSLNMLTQTLVISRGYLLVSACNAFLMDEGAAIGYHDYKYCQKNHSDTSARDE